MGLAPRKGCGALAEPDVIHAHVNEGPELALDLGHCVKEFEGLAYGHFKYICYGPALILYFQGLVIEPSPLALVAHDIHIGQEVHLDLDEPVTLAGLAPSSFDIEAEAARLVSADFCIGKHGEEFPDKGEDTRVCGRIRSGCPADGALVHIDDSVKVFQAGNALYLEIVDPATGECTA